MKTLHTIYYRKNELFEVEFYEDKECTKAFDFTNIKDLYIELKEGDCTPLFYLPSDTSVFTPYIPPATYDYISYLYNNRNICIQTLDDITINLSRYIPKNSEVLFLSEEDYDNYRDCFNGVEYCRWFENSDLISCEKNDKLTIFLPHGTQSEFQKANEIAKELKEKYGVGAVNLFALHWFLYKAYNEFDIEGEDELYFVCNEEASYQDNEVIYVDIFNKIITTNSTGILEPQDNERLQVIDCKEIFEEYLKENN